MAPRSFLRSNTSPVSKDGDGRKSGAENRPQLIIRNFSVTKSNDIIFAIFSKLIMIRIFILDADDKMREGEECARGKWAKANYLMMILTNAPRRDYRLVFRLSVGRRRDGRRRAFEQTELIIVIKIRFCGRNCDEC